MDPHYHRLRVVEIIFETMLARTFVLEPLDGWQPTYLPGQFINIVFETAMGEKRRSFSISSSPLLGEPLQITVKKLDNGEFSRKLIYNTKPGDILYSVGTAGFFVLPDQQYQQYFFLAAGSGITPIYSLVKTLLFRTDATVYLVYSNKTEDDCIFYQSLLDLEKEFPDRFKLRLLFSNRLNVYESRLSHWLLSKILEEWIGANKSSTLFYCCGPFEYMRMVNISLRSNGVSADKIIKENFNSLPAPIQIKPPDTDAHKLTIHIDENSFELMVKYPDSITKAAKKQGIQLPYSCEAGRCGTCVATCISGNIWMAYNEVLTDDEIKKGRVLTCTGFLVGTNAVIRF